MPLTNIALNKIATASSSEASYGRGPEKALDGDLNTRWCASTGNVNEWWQVDLGTSYDLSAIEILWEQNAQYGYILQASLDGVNWRTIFTNTVNLVNQNRLYITINEKSVRYVKVQIKSLSNGIYASFFEFRVFSDVPLVTKLDGTFVTNNKHYLKDSYTSIIKNSSKVSNVLSWKGEKISAEIVLWSANADINNVKLQCSNFTDKNKNIISPTNVSFNFLRYVKSAGQMIPDILDNITSVTIPGTSIQPVWVTITIPKTAIAGVYSATITASSSNATAVTFQINLEILNITVPSYDQWTFHLDLWQNPYALARYYNVIPWSQQHINYLIPHLKMLRSAGQKVITTTIIKDPWNSQTFDPYDTMVSWRKQADGTFKFDFTAFDTYVLLCLQIGIDKQINCYSMVPWNNRVIYFDEVQGKEVQEILTPGSTKWTSYWQQFINALVAHVKLKGWDTKTYIAMDERPINDMKAVVNLLKNTPLKISGAMNYGDVIDVVNSINDMSMAIWEISDDFYNIVESRRNLALNTTYYVCTGAFPNTFTYSSPGEAMWMGWYAAKFNANGFLRWAYDSWVKDPLQTTDFVRFESGDCFLVYPDARSSVRFEKLIEGFQDNEKIRYIMKAYPTWAFEIYKILKSLKGGSGDRSIDYGNEVISARNKLNLIARRIISKEPIKNITNVALNKPSKASSSEASSGRGPEKGNDGLLSSRWCASTGNINEWWQVDLGAMHSLSAIEIFWEKNVKYGYIVQVSSDEINWKNIFDNTQNTSQQRIMFTSINESSVRYVKVQIKNLPVGVFASFSECRVYGIKN